MKNIRQQATGSSGKSKGFFLPLASCLLSILLPSVLQADFEDLGVGARPLGMGDAFVGLADQAETIYYNPAGLGWLHRSQISADYSRLHTGLDDDSSLTIGFLAYAHPLYRLERFERLSKSPEVKASTATKPTLKVEGVKVVSKAKAKPTARPAGPFKVRVPDRGTLGVALRTFGLAGAYQEQSLYLSYGRVWAPRWSGGASLKILRETYQ